MTYSVPPVLSPSMYKLVSIKGDGSCLFRSIARGLDPFINPKDETVSALSLRYAAVEHVCRSSNNYKHFLNNRYMPPAMKEYSHNANVRMDAYCQYMLNPAVYGDELEILALTRVLRRPIIVYQQDRLRPGVYRVAIEQHMYGIHEFNTRRPIWLEYNAGNLHYQLLEQRRPPPGKSSGRASGRAPVRAPVRSSVRTPVRAPVRSSVRAPNVRRLAKVPTKLATTRRRFSPFRFARQLLTRK